MVAQQVAFLVNSTSVSFLTLGLGTLFHAYVGFLFKMPLSMNECMVLCDGLVS